MDTEACSRRRVGWSTALPRLGNALTGKIGVGDDYPDFKEKGNRVVLPSPKAGADARFELAIYLHPEDGEAERVRKAVGLSSPQIVARTPGATTTI